MWGLVLGFGVAYPMTGIGSTDVGLVVQNEFTEIGWEVFDGESSLRFVHHVRKD